MVSTIRFRLPLFCFCVTAIAEGGIASQTAVAQLHLRLYLDREGTRNLVAPLMGAVAKWHLLRFSAGAPEVAARFKIKNDRAWLGLVSQRSFAKWADFLLDSTDRGKFLLAIRTLLRLGYSCWSETHTIEPPV